LCDYHWPGNVRELKNLIKRLVILKPGDLITISDLENLVGNYEQLEAKPRDRVVNYAKSEYQCIERALVESRGVVGGSKGAANLLEIPKSTLQYRLKKHGIKPSDYH
jgi:DNA-binding NtrC family response regulator